MVRSVDPRANPSVGTEFVSGQITDKALALLDILNQVTGTKGNNVKQFDIIEDGHVPSNLTLGVYNVRAGINAWEANQLVYFQSTPQRLSLIQQKLQANLNKIQDDITSNISTLFDLIQKPSGQGGLGIQDQLDAAEGILSTASGDSISSTGNNLEQRIIALLTDDSPGGALDKIIDAFIANFSLDFGRLDSEIFDLLDDKDGVFSSDGNGEDSTDASAAKYLVSFGTDKPAMLVDSINKVFDIIFKSQHEEAHGIGTWTSDVEQNALSNFVGNLFNKGSLNLDPGLIDAIITDKNISNDELSKITQQGQFFQKYSFQDFLSFASDYYGTSGDTDATIKQLTLNHLQSITPQYFDDNRTLQDILSGKSNNNYDDSNLNRVFQSAGDQVKEAASSAIELLGTGHKALSKNSFEDFVKNNPILMVQYLENKDDPALKDEIQQLIEFNTRAVESQIQYYTESNKRLQKDEVANAVQIQHNQEMLDILQGPDGQGGILAKLQEYDGSNVSASDIINLYNSSTLDPELQLGSIDISKINEAALSNIIKNGLDVQNVHAALYANEILEAGKLNANYTARELPKMSDSGEMPEDKTVAPPEAAPTILSGVIAAIGNQILYKANDLLRNPNIPDSNWVSNNVGILEDIDSQIESGTITAGTTAGKAFLDNLKSAFRGIIKQFVTSDVQSFKDSVDQAKTAIASEKVLAGSNPNILDSNDTENNLNEIEFALTQDIFVAANFINKAGLSNVKVYLEDIVNQLDDTDYTTEIQQQQALINSIKVSHDLRTSKKNKLENELNSIDQTTINDANDLLQTLSELPLDQQNQLINDLGSSDPTIVTNAINSIISFAQTEIDQLKTNQKQAETQKDQLEVNQSSLDRANHLLNDQGGVNGLAAKLTSDVNSVLDPNNPPSDIKAALLDNYRTKLEDYSNKLTDHFNDDSNGDGTKDIEQIFKDTLVTTGLDLNHDGINDFQNIQSTIDKISELGDSVTNIFGSKAAQEGGVNQQSIRRLILMMFAMSILEYSDWDYNKTQADMSNYAVE